MTRRSALLVLVSFRLIPAGIAEVHMHFDSNIMALTYGDYTLTKVNVGEEDIRNWRYELKREGELLYSMGAGEVRSIYVEAALVPALGLNTQQLALQRYTGGAHCCFFSALLQLEPEFGVLFDSADYGNSLGYQLTAEDLDRDGILELQQTILTFDYFYVLPHVASPLPPAIFRYNATRRRYEPANNQFANRVKQMMQIDDARHRVETLRADADVEQVETYHPYLTAVMTVALSLAYTGDPEAARAYLEDEYTLPDKAELLRDYEVELAQCAYFQELVREEP